MTQFLAMAVLFGPVVALTAMALRNALKEARDEDPLHP
ncbi:hypothetical protein RCRUDOLPH_3 [Rhodobacter phage RcRudolph]|nr:hypothetical protein RCRUDOLPH_3 [Rhodobacter phage RcRudolph]